MPTIDELGPIIGHVETDTFCEGCGFNLFTQSVVRDERLGVLICRCPECGKFSAAGRTNSAARVWLNRLGTVLLTVWVFFLLGLFSLCTLFLGMLSFGHMTEQTTMKPDAHAANTYGYSYHYVLRDPSRDEEEARQNTMEAIILDCTGGLLAALTGGLFSVLLWHVKGWRRLPALLPPLLGSGFAALIWIAEPAGRFIREWGLKQIVAYCLFEVIATAIGVLIGRPVARAVLKILTPPKVRQHLAFLWIVDGKVLPVEHKSVSKEHEVLPEATSQGRNTLVSPHGKNIS